VHVTDKGDEISIRSFGSMCESEKPLGGFRRKCEDNIII
jgi:hypothetical protein